MNKGKKIFESEILIQVADINYGGHLGNDRFLTLAQEARVRWLRTINSNEKNIVNSNAGFIVTQASIKFLNEAFLGQTLIVQLFLEKVSKCSLVLNYELIEKEKHLPVGTISTQLAFFDYQTRKVVQCPKDFINTVTNSAAHE